MGVDNFANFLHAILPTWENVMRCYRKEIPSVDTFLEELQVMKKDKRAHATFSNLDLVGVLLTAVSLVFSIRVEFYEFGTLGQYHQTDICPAAVAFSTIHVGSFPHWEEQLSFLFLGMVKDTSLFAAKVWLCVVFHAFLLTVCRPPLLGYLQVFVRVVPL